MFLTLKNPSKIPRSWCWCGWLPKRNGIFPVQRYIFDRNFHEDFKQQFLCEVANRQTDKRRIKNSLLGAEVASYKLYPRGAESCAPCLSDMDSISFITEGVGSGRNIRVALKVRGENYLSPLLGFILTHMHSNININFRSVVYQFLHGRTDCHTDWLTDWHTDTHIHYRRKTMQQRQFQLYSLSHTHAVVPLVPSS